MKILMVGCGRFGSAMLDLLAQFEHEITVIDSNEEIIEDINNTQDVIAVCGNGADYNVLMENEVNTADVCIACTGSDEINLLICTIAKKAGAHHTVARLRIQDHNSETVRFFKENLGLDFVLNPDYLTAEAIYNILMENGTKSCTILGGTRSGEYLTELLLEKHINVTLIEKSQERCDVLCDRLPNKVTIIYDSGADHSALRAEGLEGIDAFVAITDMDEENILTSFFAAEHDIQTVVTKGSKTTYSDIAKSLNLKHLVSPRVATATILTNYIRSLQRK
ncbi:MAG TPA: hypothetical protein GX736_06485 [Mogibacterium sp.]|nr:hypothetical protein [Mogibacterium sp.]